jgi:hypothetical protein
MNDWNDEPSRASIGKIIDELRQPIHLDETFDVRVMSAVHAEALAQCDARMAEVEDETQAQRAWWRRTYTVRLSPIGGLALAASIFGLMFLGLAARSRMDGNSAASSKAVASAKPSLPPVQDVHFILVDGSAKQVWLVGDFNAWTKNQTALARGANGHTWTVSLPLRQGRHEYAFIVSDENGDRWVADPLTRVHEDEFGTESSVVSVGAAQVSPAI